MNILFDPGDLQVNHIPSTHPPIHNLLLGPYFYANPLDPKRGSIFKFNHPITDAPITGSSAKKRFMGKYLGAMGGNTWLLNGAINRYFARQGNFLTQAKAN